MTIIGDGYRCTDDDSSSARPFGIGIGCELPSVFSGAAGLIMAHWFDGVIPGGALAILADSALAAAIGTALPANTGLVTSELSLRFLRPVSAGGHLVAHGTLVHVGRSIGLSHVRITDGQGRLIADGSSMCFIKPLPPPADGAGQPYENHEDRFVADLGLAQLDPWQRPALGQVLSQDVWDRMSGLEIF